MNRMIAGIYDVTPKGFEQACDEEKARKFKLVHKGHLKNIAFVEGNEDDIIDFVIDCFDLEDASEVAEIIDWAPINS